VGIPLVDWILLSHIFDWMKDVVYTHGKTIVYKLEKYDSALIHSIQVKGLEQSQVLHVISLYLKLKDAENAIAGECSILKVLLAVLNNEEALRFEMLTYLILHAATRPNILSFGVETAEDILGMDPDSVGLGPEMCRKVGHLGPIFLWGRLKAKIQRRVVGFPVLMERDNGFEIVVLGKGCVYGSVVLSTAPRGIRGLRRGECLKVFSDYWCYDVTGECFRDRVHGNEVIISPEPEHKVCVPCTFQGLLEPFGEMANHLLFCYSCNCHDKRKALSEDEVQTGQERVKALRDQFIVTKQ